ncbi:hypothetical protein PoB_005118800 [Plakobranchus ocellatus]|uniref:Uncharacterized protein n=1 Tax=Plakobranchus ocellatus TaxID=259542 RepID=A0AAV4BYH4_9GAST|nr:hypothetical protein PoB_005118800 [Plakobranchus ocellatus]
MQAYQENVISIISSTGPRSRSLLVLTPGTMEGPPNQPSPYIWIKSQKLRSPHNPPRPFSADNSNQQKRFYSSSSVCKFTNRHMSRLPPKTEPCVSSEDGARRVKTATSDDLFQTGIEPAYIDHNGDLINPAQSTNSAQTKVRPKSSRTGWGVMLPPPPLDMSEEGDSHESVQELEDLDTRVAVNSVAKTSLIAVENNHSQKTQKGQIDDKVWAASEAHDLDGEQSSRPKSALAAAVDRAWPETPVSTLRAAAHINAPESSSQFSRAQTSKRYKMKGRRVVSAAPIRQYPQAPENMTSAHKLTPHKIRVATPSVSHRIYLPAEEEDSKEISSENKNVGRVRPITTAGAEAKRYVKK